MGDVRGNAMQLTARVPATSANLGPGFDALAMALALYNEVSIDTDAAPGVTVSGEGAGELPEDATNLTFRSMAYLARETGGTLPPFALTGHNAIPLERGLGSSAAAVVAGLLLADRLMGTELPPDRILEVAIDVEGHPDNVAACLRGGVIVAHLSADGWRAEHVAPHPDLRPVVLVPEHERVVTADARRVLPRQVPMEDAVFNAGRAALTVVALTERPDLLFEALEDRLHQPHRLRLVPSARSIYQKLREADIPVCVSGAGTSLLAFEQGGARIPELGPGWRVLRPGIAAEGATIS